MYDPSIQPPEKQSVPANTPRKVVGVVVQNTNLVFGISLVLIIIGVFLLAWFERPIPELISVFGGAIITAMSRIFEPNSSGTSGGSGAN